MRHPVIYHCFSLSQIVLYYLLNSNNPLSRLGAAGLIGTTGGVRERVLDP